MEVNADYIAIAVALIPILWGSYQYILIKKAEEKNRRYITYHKLIRELSEGNGETVYVYDQTAVVYELKNYPEYANASIRILKDLKNRNFYQDARFSYFIEQISETIKHLNKSYR